MTVAEEMKKSTVARPLRAYVDTAIPKDVKHSCQENMRWDAYFPFSFLSY